MLRRSRCWVPALGMALLLAGVLPARAESGRLKAAPLSRLCRELSTRFGETIRVERGLADLRVLWSDDVPDARAAVDRLAELTDSLVDARDGASGHRTYTLERKTATVRREALWKTEAIAAGVRQLAQAYEWREKGDPRASGLASSQVYLKQDHLRAGGRCLRALTPEQLATLAQGGEVRFPAGFLADAECQQMFRGIWSFLAQVDTGKPTRPLVTDVEKAVADSLDAVRHDGVGIRLDVDRELAATSMVHVLLTYGPSRPGYRPASIGLGVLSDADLGLPLTHTNPYRFLERNPAAGAPVAALSAALRKPLDTPVTIPQGASWRIALRTLSRAARLPLASDDYLCRIASNTAAGALKDMTFERGTSVAEALDRLCDCYYYLWWEKNGCCYFRSRYWPDDVELEVPPPVLDQVTTALERGRPLGTGELGALASLTRRQLRGLFRLRIDGQPLARTQINASAEGLLRLYPRLTPVERAVLTGDGVLVRSDAEPTFEFLRSMGPNEPRLIRMRLTQTVTRLPEQMPRGWKVACKLTLQFEGDKRESWAKFEFLFPGPDMDTP